MYKFIYKLFCSENGDQKWDPCSDKLEQVFGGMLKNLEWEKLQNATSRAQWAILLGLDSEDKNTNSNTDSKGCVPEVSEDKTYFIWNWTRGHSCQILANNWAVFCSCPETLGEADLKCNGLRCLESIFQDNSTF